MPKPNKHVFVCSQNRQEGHPRGSCAASGAGSLMNAFETAIRARHLQQHIAVTQTGCLGPCQHGANVLIYPDGVMYQQVIVDDIDTIIEQHLLNGQLITEKLIPEESW